jgi:hypothetical protein
MRERRPRPEAAMMRRAIPRGGAAALTAGGALR